VTTPSLNLGSRWLSRALALITVAPIVIAIARALRNDWFPIGDNALLYIRVADVFTEHHPWLGSWTSASLSVGENMNNPGPVYADLAAPFAKVFSPGPGAAIGVGVLNILSVLGISAAARRLGGAAMQHWALLAAAGLSWSMGSEMLIDLWQAHSLLLPFLLLVVLLVGVADGATWCIPWSLALVSVQVQTHISYSYILAILCPVAAVSYALVRRGRPHLPWRSALRSRPAILSAALLVLLWSQTLIEQFFGPGKGNLSRLLGNAGGGDLQVGARTSARITATLFTLPPWWFRSGFSTSVPNTGVTGPPDDPRLVIPSLPSLGISLFSLAVLVAVLIVLARHHRHRSTHVLSAACLMAAAAVIGSLLSVSMLTVGLVGFSSHHVRFLWPLSVFAHVAVLATVAHHLHDRLGDRPRLARSARWVPAAATVLLAIATVPAHVQPQGPVANYSSMPTLRRVMSELDSLAGVQPVVFDISTLRPFEPFSATVMMRLQELDIEFRVTDEGMVRQLGESRRADGTEPARIFQLQGPEALLYDGDACLVVLASELPAGDEGTARERAEDLAARLAGGEIVVDDAALADADSTLGPVLQAARNGDLSAARAIVYGGHLSWWYRNGHVDAGSDLTGILPVIDVYLNTAYALFSDQSLPCS
jgi:hypothetical protein